MRSRAVIRVVFAALMSGALTLSVAGTAEARPHHRHFPDQIALPVGFQPEGITIGKAPYAFLGSLADGDIYAVSLKTGKGRVVSQGPGTPSVGLKIDRRGLLYVSGGPSGTSRIVNLRSGKVTSYTLTTKTSFINDVVLTRKAAWFTNSSQAELYSLSRGNHRGKRIVTTLPLKGEWVQPTGFGANGIVQTPDQRALLVIESATGTLFRVNKHTGNATKVDLGGVPLTNGDGMLLHGRKLYVVQNQLNQIAVVKLNKRGTAGTVDPTRLTNPEFDVPTTVASYKGSLYLPNARFGTPPAGAEYSINRVDK